MVEPRKIEDVETLAPGVEFTKNASWRVGYLIHLHFENQGQIVS